jgi:exodeoxyribonuclease VII large subunit
MATLYSVSEITAYVKHLFESDSLLQGVQVAGEVSNLTYHGSGHVYFSVKDRDAQLSCVMFRSYAQRAPRMQQGDKVVLTGSFTVYAPRGNYQLMVREVRKQGLGDLYQRFVALKGKLEGEGLFAPERKRALPAFPRCIAVVTSPTGAAVRDILRTLRRRYGRGRVIVIPTVVQGEQGAPSVVRSLQAASQTPAEVIILARGGGSLEDLWNFNEETVARAMAACPLPIICGVGHETDITIADFVADYRASTPTAAAEAAVPDRQAILNTLTEYERQIHRNLQYFIDFKRQILDDYTYRMEQAMRQYLQNQRHTLDLLESQLQGLDPNQVLRQGYSLTLKEGKRVREAQQLRAGDEVDLVFLDGRRRAQIQPEKE